MAGIAELVQPNGRPIYRADFVGDGPDPTRITDLTAVGTGALAVQVFNVLVLTSGNTVGNYASFWTTQQRQPARDIGLLAQITPSDNSGSYYFRIILKSPNNSVNAGGLATEGYGIRLRNNATDGFRIVRYDSGSEFSIADQGMSGFSLQANIDHWLRFEMRGTHISAKLWPQSAREPTVQGITSNEGVYITGADTVNFYGEPGLVQGHISTIAGSATRTMSIASIILYEPQQQPISFINRLEVISPTITIASAGVASITTTAPADIPTVKPRPPVASITTTATDGVAATGDVVAAAGVAGIGVTAPFDTDISVSLTLVQDEPLGIGTTVPEGEEAAGNEVGVADITVTAGDVTNSTPDSQITADVANITATVPEAVVQQTGGSGNVTELLVTITAESPTVTIITGPPTPPAPVLYFTPPVRDYGSSYLPYERHPGNRLFRHYRPRPEGINVFIYSNNTVSEVEPDGYTTLWFEYQRTSDTLPNAPYVTHAFWGGHEREEVTEAEAALLTNAGYTIESE